MTLSLVEQLSNLETFLKEEGYSVEEVNKVRDGRRTQYYNVTLNCDFEATSPEEAVQQMIEWLYNEAGTAYYEATDTSGKMHPVDAYDLHKDLGFQ